MKLKVAVFATAWSEEMISAYMDGIRRGLENISADVYSFVCYPALSDSKEFIKGELNIFSLPDLNNFDGVLILGNTIDFPDALNDIVSRCKEAGIPAVFTGQKFKDCGFVGTDNYYGARLLCEHLYDIHGVRDFFYIAGSRDNMDSNLRLKAIQDVLSENGQTFSEDKVFYTDWSPKNEMVFIRGMISQGEKLPRAFLCANDELAILLCEELRNAEINVPDDVIVTGFDNLPYAQIYDPSICTVSQRFDLIGYESVLMMLDIINGTDCETERFIKCEYISGESCGCTECSSADMFRRTWGRNAFLSVITSSAFYRKLSIIDRCITKDNSYEEASENFRIANEDFNYYEGSSYHVILDPVYKQKLLNPAVEYNTDGYPEKMNVFFSVSNGNYFTQEDFPVKEIVPQSDDGRNHLFICAPLHDSDRVLGYIVFADDYTKFKTSEFIGKYTERMSAALVRLQQTVNTKLLNERLTELYQTDALTLVKNRAAFQTREISVNEQIRQKKISEFAVLLCDINNLKTVNDLYGHEQGDTYIRNCCTLICSTFKKSAVYRIGGDEFVLLLTSSDFEHSKDLVKSINEKMCSIMNQELPVIEKPSIAIGISYFDINSDSSVADVLKRADSQMYKRKREMKKEQ